MDQNVTVLIENTFFPFLSQIIKSAQYKIYAIIYYAKIHSKNKGNDVNKLVDLLIHKQKNNIEVFVLINNPQQKNFVLTANKEFSSVLKKNGIHIKHTNTNRCTHAKLFLIDNNVSILGSHNLSEKALHSNREISLCVVSEEVNKRLTDYFLKEFYEAKDTW